MDLTLESCRSIFNGVSDVIFVFDPKTGSVVGANNAVSEMYGYTPEEAKNADIGTLSAGQYPYNYQGGMERIRRAVDGPPRLFDWLARDRSGRVFWVEAHLKRAAVNGEDRVLAVVREMPGRRRTEQRLSLQYTVARVLTEAGSLTQATPMILRSICEHVGWDRGEVWFTDADTPVLRLGGDWHVFPDDLKQFRAESMTFSHGSGLAGRVWAEGRPVWITDLAEAPFFLRTAAAIAAGLRAAFAFPIKSAGRILGAMAFFGREVQPPDNELIEMFDALGSQIGDFIKRKKTEEDLRRCAAELERNNEQLNMFVSVASHDLQEPLRVITGFSQLLEGRYKGRLDRKADEFIGYIVDGSLRMQQLILDLLTYSRITTAGSAFGPVDCNAAVQIALTNLKAAVEESRAEITVEKLPVVSGDESQIARLFQNLIGNAVKFGADKTPVVRVSCEHVEDIAEGDEGKMQKPGWLFSVCDNGIGIEQQYFDRIFQAFERLHSRQEYPGTGMGLAICGKIVERHGGGMRVISEVGKGSTFFFTIPDAGVQEVRTDTADEETGAKEI
jgi:PAS domain S-box-containing protein